MEEQITLADVAAIYGGASPLSRHLGVTPQYIYGQLKLAGGMSESLARRIAAADDRFALDRLVYVPRQRGRPWGAKDSYKREVTR